MLSCSAAAGGLWGQKPLNSAVKPMPEEGLIAHIWSCLWQGFECLKILDYLGSRQILSDLTGSTYVPGRPPLFCESPSVKPC